MLKQGSFLSEANLAVVVKVGNDDKGNTAYLLRNVNTGEEFGVTEQYRKANMQNGVEYTETKKVSRTEMNNIILSATNTAISVSFHKKYSSKDAAKEVKQLLATNSNPSESELAKVITLLGEDRTMVGYHTGDHDSHMYLVFYDAEALDNSGRPTRKSVNLQTAYQAVINGTKYIVK